MTKINNKKIFYQILMPTLIALINACQSTGDNEITYQEDEVLFMMGEKIPQISKIDEDKWILISESEDQAIDSVYANLALGEIKTAVGLARNIVESSPNNLDALSALARSLISQKKPALAAYYAQYVLEKDKSRLHMYNIIGLADASSAHTISDYGRAKENFKKAMADKRYPLAAALNLGSIELETGANANAKSAFKKASGICGECGASMLGLGIAERRLGNISSSVDALETAKKTKALELIANYHLSLSIRKDGESKKALDLIKDVIDKAPDREEILISRSEALMNHIQEEIDKKQLGKN